MENIDQSNKRLDMKKILMIIPFTALLVLVGCSKKNEPTVKNDKAVGTVTDVCGNVYNYVKIGEQYWMAENMRCNKYDTKSERSGFSLSKSSYMTMTPYYTDASDKSLWELTFDDASVNLSDAQVSILGYLYNWAAAVGVEDGQNQTSAFSVNRQGICPNDWHVPTDAEWDALAKAIGGVVVDKYGDFMYIGNKLKAKSGWYINYDADGNGTDDYGFMALPAGGADGKDVYAIGQGTLFWTVTPNSLEGPRPATHYVRARELDWTVSELYSSRGEKDWSYSVRCVKD